MLSSYSLKIDRAYHQPERRAEVATDGQVAAAREHDRMPGRARVLGAAVRAWLEPSHRASTGDRTLAGRVLARSVLRLRHAPGTLALLVLLPLAVLGWHQAHATTAPDCADTVIAYQFHKTAQTTHAAYACLADPPEWEEFVRQSLRPSVKAQIHREGSFAGSAGTLVFFAVATPSGDQAYVVHLNHEGKVWAIE